MHVLNAGADPLNDGLFVAPATMTKARTRMSESTWSDLQRTHPMTVARVLTHWITRELRKRPYDFPLPDLFSGAAGSGTRKRKATAAQL